MKDKINYLTFGVVVLILIVLVIFYQDWKSSRNFLSQPTSATQEKTSAGILDNIFSTSPRVKKSSTGICHEKDVSLHYNRTQNYTSYNSVRECLDSGGRLPLR
ncbi:MAG: putative exclusion protein [Parcubacteria group bacterium GW2011_GWC2_42_13]|nr:MAG: putative exclusion protein [Parcubacteria group bacterium GW2011_GWC2_42_13]